MKQKNPVYSILAVRTVQASALGMAAHWMFHWPLTGSHALGLFLTPALCLYFMFVFVGPWTWGLPILAHLPGRQNAVALTFDDGPSPETTPVILDILREEDARATFFVLGEAAERYPDLLRRTAAEGHSIGIHAYRHAPFVLKSAQAIRSEIARTESAIRSACPDTKIIPWLRPPNGFKSPGLIWVLRRAGYRPAAWSVDSRDYRESDPARIAAHVLGKSQAGVIILLHDGPENAATAPALRTVLRGLAERGLILVSLGKA